MDILCLLLVFVISYFVYRGIEYVCKYDLGKRLLTIYLVIKIATDLVDLLLYILE